MRPEVPQPAAASRSLLQVIFIFITSLALKLVTAASGMSINIHVLALNNSDNQTVTLV